MTTTTRDCEVCDLIRSGSATGRTEFWRTMDTVAYIYTPNAESVG